MESGREKNERGGRGRERRERKGRREEKEERMVVRDNFMCLVIVCMSEQLGGKESEREGENRRARASVVLATVCYFGFYLRSLFFPGDFFSLCCCFCACMCMCVYVYIYGCVYMCVYVYVYVCVCVSAQGPVELALTIRAETVRHTHMHTRIHTHTHIYTHTYTHPYIHGFRAAGAGASFSTMDLKRSLAQLQFQQHQQDEEKIKAIRNQCQGRVTRLENQLEEKEVCVCVCVHDHSLTHSLRSRRTHYVRSFTLYISSLTPHTHTHAHLITPSTHISTYSITHSPPLLPSPTHTSHH